MCRTVWSYCIALLLRMCAAKGLVGQENTAHMHAMRVFREQLLLAEPPMRNLRSSWGGLIRPCWSQTLFQTYAGCLRLVAWVLVVSAVPLPAGVRTPQAGVV